jgi:hypothetical protein
MVYVAVPATEGVSSYEPLQLTGPLALPEMMQLVALDVVMVSVTD